MTVLTGYRLYVNINYGAPSHYGPPDFLGKRRVLWKLLMSLKKMDLMKEPSEYYSDKFNELNLTKRLKDYQDAFLKLKDEYKSLYTYNENICVINIANNQTSYIKKEHFQDNLSDDEKEYYYSKIKKFTTAVSRGERILTEWEESLEFVNENFYKEEPMPPDSPSFQLLYQYQYILNSFKAVAPPPWQPIKPPLLDQNFECKQPPKGVVEFLYNLCYGNINELKKLAEFSYNLIHNPKDCLSTVILADKKIHEALRNYFDLLAYPHFKNWYEELVWTDFNTLRLKEVRAIFLELEFKRNPPIVLIKENTIYKLGATYSYFKRLLTGKKIRIDSPYFDDELIIKNTLPIIYITSDEGKYNTMRNMYNSKEIKLFSKELDIIEKSAKSADWLRNEFLCIGKKAVPINKKITDIYKLDPKEIVKKFIRLCCTFKEDEKCSKREFHKAYIQYCKHCYPEENYLTQPSLCKVLLEQKHDKIYTDRLHESRKGPYLNYIFGMGLKENYSELYKNEPVHRRVKTEKEKFEVMLNNLVRETFNDLKLDVRTVGETIDSKTGEVISQKF